MRRVLGPGAVGALVTTGDEVVVERGGRLAAFDVRTGRPRWSVPTPGGGTLAAGGGGRVAVLGASRILLLDGATGRAPTTGVARLAVHGRAVALTAREAVVVRAGDVRWLRLADGRLLARRTVRPERAASPAGIAVVAAFGETTWVGGRFDAVGGAPRPGLAGFRRHALLQHRTAPGRLVGETWLPRIAVDRRGAVVADAGALGGSGVLALGRAGGAERRLAGQATGALAAAIPLGERLLVVNPARAALISTPVGTATEVDLAARRIRTAGRSPGVVAAVAPLGAGRAVLAAVGARAALRLVVIDLRGRVRRRLPLLRGRPLALVAGRRRVVVSLVEGDGLRERVATIDLAAARPPLRVRGACRARCAGTRLALRGGLLVRVGENALGQRVVEARDPATLAVRWQEETGALDVTAVAIDGPRVLAAVRGDLGAAGFLAFAGATGARTSWGPAFETRGLANGPAPGLVTGFVSTGSRVLVCGRFTHVAGERRRGLVLLARDGALRPWRAEGGTCDALALGHGRIALRADGIVVLPAPA